MGDSSGPVVVDTSNGNIVTGGSFAGSSFDFGGGALTGSGGSSGFVVKFGP